MYISEMSTGRSQMTAVEGAEAFGRQAFGTLADYIGRQAACASGQNAALTPLAPSHLRTRKSIRRGKEPAAGK